MTIIQFCRLAVLATLPVLSGCSLHCAGAQMCLPPTRSKVDQVGEYIAQLSKGFLPSRYIFQKSDRIANSCFWKLTYKDRPSHNYVTVILSPDQAFLVSSVLDMRISLTEAELKEREEANVRLTAAGGPSIGGASAPVTIVEFSDFECPYCKKLTDTMTELHIPSENVKIVYHNYPLSMHPWALPAAEIAACVAKQNAVSLWKLQAFAFSHQQDINPQNVHQLLMEQLRADDQVDVSKVSACITSGEGDELVDKDLLLGNELDVRATPTFYIDGEVTRGAINADQLRILIQNAANRGKHGNSCPATSSSATQLSGDCAIGSDGK